MRGIVNILAWQSLYYGYLAWKMYTGCTQAVHRPYTGRTQAVHRPYTGCTTMPIFYQYKRIVRAWIKTILKNAVYCVYECNVLCLSWFPNWNLEPSLNWVRTRIYTGVGRLHYRVYLCVPVHAFCSCNLKSNRKVFFFLSLTLKPFLWCQAQLSVARSHAK